MDDKPDDKPPKKKYRPFWRPRKRRSTRPGAHTPILLAEVLQCLDPLPGQVMVDGTLGFAGHSAALLQKLGPDGLLIATDLDPGYFDTARQALDAVGHPYRLHHANFAGLPAMLAAEGIPAVDGLLADLGMSSMQVDDTSRGFSFMRDGPLDMRMDQSRGKTAAELLNTLPEEELAAALREFGDEPQADAIAAAIGAARKNQPLERTTELRTLIETAAPVRVIRGPGAPPERKQLLMPATRVFQTLRILVNRELANLSHLLRILPYVLKPGGTAALISFHSGEDRLIKTAFRDGVRSGLYEAASGDPIRPQPQERIDNPRSRSAKLRWARTPKS